MKGQIPLVCRNRISHVRCEVWIVLYSVASGYCLLLHWLLGCNAVSKFQRGFERMYIDRKFESTILQNRIWNVASSYLRLLPQVPPLSKCFCMLLVDNQKLSHFGGRYSSSVDPSSVWDSTTTIIQPLSLFSFPLNIYWKHDLHTQSWNHVLSAHALVATRDIVKRPAFA
jgi:hypothetical protein